jgi:hypothetical protein
MAKFRLSPIQDSALLCVIKARLEKFCVAQKSPGEGPGRWSKKVAQGLL